MRVIVEHQKQIRAVLDRGEVHGLGGVIANPKWKPRVFHITGGFGADLT